ncbi:MAG: hypothetical protein J6333_00130, partial [Planctomycetes bacterium]|nr:hypothetical protein [Planctomycetota bacterium]
DGANRGANPVNPVNPVPKNRPPPPKTFVPFVAKKTLCASASLREKKNNRTTPRDMRQETRFPFADFANLA